MNFLLQSDWTTLIKGVAVLYICSILSDPATEDIVDKAKPNCLIEAKKLNDSIFAFQFAKFAVNVALTSLIMDAALEGDKHTKQRVVKGLRSQLRHDPATGNTDYVTDILRETGH